MNDLVSLFDMNLMSLATSYDLTDKKERGRSVGDLEATFFNLAETLQPSHLFEIGANDARISHRARRDLPETSIIAFEASPHNYRRHAHSAHIASSVIDYRNVAIGAISGKTPFYVKTAVNGRDVLPHATDNSLLKRSDVEAEYEELVVSCARLDDQFKNVESSFFWVDVGGATEMVFQGAVSLLGSCKAVMVEVEDREYWKGQWLYSDVLKYLIDAGFVPALRDFQSRYQYNVLFLRSDILWVDRVRHLLVTHKSRAARGRA